MIYLASASPRRRELLAQVGVGFEVLRRTSMRCVRVAKRRTTMCCGSRATRHGTWPGRGGARPAAAPGVGADTEVVVDGDILGKPRDRAHATAMLRALAGQTHTVLTGLCLVTVHGEHTAVCTSRVTMAPLSDGEIGRYVATGEADDKAGPMPFRGAPARSSPASRQLFGRDGSAAARVARTVRSRRAGVAMSEEVLINVTPQETRVAVVENGVLQEVHIERARARGIVGNIYQGRVTRILPGMQAAFVDVGLERAAFLHASDVRVGLRDGTEPAASPGISELLHDGQDVVVQVVKDPLGTKGARVTTHVTLPARYLVYMPYSRHIGVSQKIGDDAERERLRAMLKSALEGTTAAVSSCAPWPAMSPKRNWRPTSATCAACGRWCRNAPPARLPAACCTRTCRWHCAQCATW